MRLLQVDEDGEFSLTDHNPNITTPYAILSHTWGDDNEEVSYKDLVDRSGKTKAGYEKLRFCATQAARDGLKHFWVDTCCINKDSSAELSEAIVSMFRWYQRAARCYVYLSDISVATDSVALQQGAWKQTFRQSRWFTRGWTLQELIAPRSVQFFSGEANYLGDKKSLERQIHEITGIAIQALQGTDLSRFTVDERMVWASNRETTRAEDKAYCLLGIFQIFMLPMYGEGREHAFYRLQEEIDKRSQISEYQQATTPGNAREGLATWLQPATVADDLRELLKRRYAGTCHWFLEKAEFRGWRPDLAPILWLHGKPGSGKSVLTAALIEHLQTNETVTAYFFCRLGDDTKRSLESILRTWLWQILEQMPQFANLALQHRQKGPGIFSHLEVIENALREVILLSPKITCLVVDGIDECESAPTTVEKLLAFVSTLGENILFALISRPENWVRKAVYPRMEGKCCNIPISNEATEQDLDRWIRACVLEMQLSSPSLEQLAIEKLQEGADGMFLWARFQLEALGAQFMVEDAKAVLQNELPKDLEATYERLLTNLEMESSSLRRARAFRILQWITASNRPLTLAELDFALGIQIDAKLSPKQRSLLRGETDVLDACGPFVEITKAGQIRFVHASAKDFLSSRGIQFGFAPSRPLLPSSPSQKEDAMYIARACITCLSFSDIDLIGKRPGTPSRSEELLHNTVEKYPFLEYAAMNWWKHLGEVPLVDSELLQHTIRRFLGSSETTLRWLYLYQYLLGFHPEESELLDPTATSCWKFISDFWNNHLGPNTSNLFNRWQRWHVEMRFGPGLIWPPLHIAAFFNFGDMVEQELKHGAAAGLQNQLKFTTLMQAAHGDSPEAAQVLINNGANVHAETKYGYTAVRYACRNSLSTLPLVLKAGGRADWVDHLCGQTALHEIAGSVLFHPKILSTLLNLPYISDIINIQDHTFKTPLDYAAAIDLPSSASRVYDRSYDGIGGIKIVDGWGGRAPSTMSIFGDYFSAQGTTALSVLQQGWWEAGVHTPMDFTYESVLGAMTAWKAEIIQKLLEKGAKSRNETRRISHESWKKAIRARLE